MSLILRTKNLSSAERGDVWLTSVFGALLNKGDMPNQLQAIVQDGRARCLSPVERERLQGYDGQHTDGVALRHRVAMIGDSVCVSMFCWIGGRL